MTVRTIDKQKYPDTFPQRYDRPPRPVYGENLTDMARAHGLRKIGSPIEDFETLRTMS